METIETRYGPAREAAGDVEHPPSDVHRSLSTWLAVAVAAAILVWTALAIAVDSVPLALFSPQGQTGVEAASALARFFGAMVLLLFPEERLGFRLRWVAAGFIVLGLGALLFGFLWPLLEGGISPNETMYASFVIWSTAGTLFVIGLVPFISAPFSRQAITVTALLVTVVALLTVIGSDSLPPLVTVTDIELADLRHDVPLRGLTGWHWVLSSIPFGLAIVAVAGAIHFYRLRDLGGWLLIAMIFLAGAQLHNLLWPSIYSPLLTTANLLRFLFAAVVIVGGVLELRRVAAQRAQLLATEQEFSRRLSELAELKNDFTAMVAHEIGSPLAAIRGWAALLDLRDLSPHERGRALAAIDAEVDLLHSLIDDVRDISAIERSDFSVERAGVPINVLLEDATAFGAMLPGDHPLSVTNETSGLVWADRERIGQVMRNLLSNAAKYSPRGTPIHITTTCVDRYIRIEVVDQGFGILPEDQERIFQRFGRGSSHQRLLIGGTGLGLYVSRRILEAHGSTVTVNSTPGEGSVFGFELEVTR